MALISVKKKKPYPTNAVSPQLEKYQPADGGNVNVQTQPNGVGDYAKTGGALAAGNVANANGLRRRLISRYRQPKAVAPETTVVTGMNGELPGSTPGAQPGAAVLQGTGTQQGAPAVDVNAQSQRLKVVAAEMQRQREAGNPAAAEELLPEYSALLASMKKQVSAVDANAVPTANGEAPTGTGLTADEQAEFERLQSQMSMSYGGGPEAGPTRDPAMVARFNELQAKMAAASGKGTIDTSTIQTGTQQGAPTITPEERAKWTAMGLTEEQMLEQKRQQSMGQNAIPQGPTTDVNAAADLAKLNPKAQTQQTAQGATSGGPAGGTGGMDNESSTPVGTAGANSVKAKYDQDVVDQTNNAVSVFTTKGKLPQAQAQALTDWIKTNNRVPTDADYQAMFPGMSMARTGAGDLIFYDPAKGGLIKDAGGNITGVSNGAETFRVNSETRAVAGDWAKQYASMSTKWQEQGQYEQQLQDMFASQAAQSGYKIEDLPETMKNELYREAIDAMKNGQDPKEIIGDYLSYFDQNPDFSLGNNQYQEAAKDLHAYEGVNSPTITEQNITVGGGDTSAITNALNAASQSQAGAEATKLAMAAAQKLQNPGPFTEADINALTAGKFAQLDAEMNAAVSAAGHDAAMAGAGGSGTTVDQVAAIKLKAIADKRAFLGEILKEKMAQDQQGFIESMSTLTGVAKDEADRLLAERGQNITGTTAATEITADMGKAQAELQYKTKALYQEGGLTAAGQQIDQNLKAYDMSLTKYQTDKGFDEAGLDRDLKARIAEQGGTVEEQKLKYQQVKDSIDAAQKQVEQTDKRNAEIANLEQDAAQGDTDAKLKIQGLKVEQDLQNAGFKEEHQKTLGTLIYGLLSQRIQITADMEMLLKKYQLEKELQGSETMDFIGQILGNAATVAAALL